MPPTDLLEHSITPPTVAQRSSLIGTENAFKIGPFIRQLESEGHQVIKCNLGEPDFPVPTHIRDEIIAQVEADNAHYCDPQGLLSLRRAIATHFSRTRSIDITADHVVVFPGAKPPIGLCQQTYINSGDQVIYPSPGFPIYESFTRYVGAVPVPVQLREDQGFMLDKEDLAAAITPATKMIFLNFPSNPTGGVASRAQLEQLAEVILSTAPPDVRVYSDEVYEDILFDGQVHQSVASIPGMDKRTIIVSGASKSFSWTGGRVGWAAFPTIDEARLLTNLNINYFSCVPPYNQEGARMGLESPASAGYIAGMVEAFQARRDLVVSELNHINGITCQTPKGAFYVFPNISGVCQQLDAFNAYRSLSEDEQRLSSPATLVQMFILFRHHVATMDRRSFGQIGADDQHYLRMSIATGMDDLREAVRRIARAAVDLQGFRDFLQKGGPLY